MEIITLQTLMVQLKERLAQPDCWSLVAESGNTFFDCKWTFSYEKNEIEFKVKLLRWTPGWQGHISMLNPQKAF